MVTARRIVATAAVALVTCVLWAGQAEAQTGACNRTNLSPGESITVNGSGAIAGETATLRFEGSAIGATTVDGFGNFSVSGNIPASTPPGVYTISVTFTTSPTIVPCTVTVQNAAPPTPTPTATPDPDDDDDDDDDADDDDDDSDDDQQQQQQQQQGGGPGGQQQQQAGGGQQQQQQQQLIIPAALVDHRVVAGSFGGGGGGRSLPQSGNQLDLAQTTGVATGLLLVGFSLIDIARRRRTQRVQPATATARTASMSEAALLLPYWDR